MAHMTEPTRPHEPPVPDTDSEELDRFQDLARRLVAVPKSDVDALRHRKSA